MRSPLLATTLPAVALVAGLVRWLLQGSGNLYTATARRAYVPDPDLGWRVVQDGPVWLGLEVLGLIAAALVGVALGGWLLRRLERRRPRPALRGLLWAVAAVPLVVPAWAFATGFGPDGARDTLPDGQRAAAPLATDGIRGALDAPAGAWTVVAHPGAAVTARVSAGGEAFDARFTGGLTGTWTVDPRDLTGEMRVEVSVDTASVDTGIALRSKSAREDYLQASKFPRLTFRLTELVAARADGPTTIAYRATGEVELIGDRVPVELTGTLRLLDAAARARLELPADAPAIVAEADFAIPIAATRLAADAGDFDGDAIPVHATLVLTPPL